MENDLKMSEKWTKNANCEQPYWGHELIKRRDFCGCQQRRWSEENGFVDDERRAEMSRGHFVGAVDTIGSSVMSSAQLKRVETRDSGLFWMEMGYFSTFWWFSVKSPEAERVLRDVLTKVGAVCSVGGCDSKSGCNSLFSWLVGCEMLAVVESARECKTLSLGVSWLVYTLVVSFPGPLTPRAWISGDILVGMCVFSTFSCFWAKSAVNWRVSGALVVVESVVEFG